MNILLSSAISLVETLLVYVWSIIVLHHLSYDYDVGFCLVRGGLSFWPLLFSHTVSIALQKQSSCGAWECTKLIEETETCWNRNVFERVPATHPLKLKCPLKTFCRFFLPSFFPVCPSFAVNLFIRSTWSNFPYSFPLCDCCSIFQPLKKTQLTLLEASLNYVELSEGVSEENEGAITV